MDQIVKNFMRIRNTSGPLQETFNELKENYF
jgi:hypothetical protein